MKLFPLVDPVDLVLEIVDLYKDVAAQSGIELKSKIGKNIRKKPAGFLFPAGFFHLMSFFIMLQLSAHTDVHLFVETG